MRPNVTTWTSGVDVDEKGRHHAVDYRGTNVIVQECRIHGMTHWYKPRAASLDYVCKRCHLNKKDTATGAEAARQLKYRAAVERHQHRLDNTDEKYWKDLEKEIND